MTIEGEHLGEPAVLTVGDDGAFLTYTPKPGAAATTERVTVAELRPARFRGLGPFHAFALFFAVGAYFAKMPWLAIAFGAAGVAHAVVQLVQPPQVLVLAGGRDFIVARRSLEQARELVSLRAPR